MSGVAYCIAQDKRIYRHWNAAERAAYGLRADTGGGTDPYPCKHCGGVHLRRLAHHERLQTDPYPRRKRVQVRAELRGMAERWNAGIELERVTV